MKKSKPKRLNLSEMWRVYLLLKPSIDGRETEEFVANEIQKIIELSTPKALLESINLLYDNKIEFDTFDDYIELFISALYQSDFFGFIGFIKGLTDAPNKSR